MPFEIIYANKELSVNWEWPNDCIYAKFQKGLISLESDTKSVRYVNIADRIERTHTPDFSTPLIDTSSVYRFRIVFCSGGGDETTHEYPAIYYYGSQKQIIWKAKEAKAIGDSALILEIDSPERIHQSRLWVKAGDMKWGLPTDVARQTVFIIPEGPGLDGIMIEGDEYIRKKYSIERR